MLTLENSPPARGKGARWQKGQSGNPAGRPRQYDGLHITEYARLYTRDAVHALVLSLKHPSTRVPAAIALLDRGWGKPEQRIHAQSESTVLHLIAAQAFGVELQQQTPTIEHSPATTTGAEDTPTE